MNQAILDTELLRGHLKECFADLKKRLDQAAPKFSKGAGELRRPIADFCGVKGSSVLRWLTTNEHQPNGETLVRVLCYLQMIGYRVIEFERLPSSIRNFAELIGFQVLAGQEAFTLLGYSEQSTLFKVIKAGKGVSAEKEQKMWEIWKERRTDLEVKKKKLAELYSLKLTLAHDTTPVLTQEPVPPKSQKGVHRTVVMSMMESLVALLDDGALADLSLQELGNIHLTVLRLSGHLTDLSSRLHILKHQKGAA